MAFPSKLTRRSALLVAAMPLVSWSNQPAAPVLSAQAAIKQVADFNEGTWAELLKTGSRPAAYVFTTTYCSTCPDAFEKLKVFIASAKTKVELVAVVMDVPAERALVHARHFAGATQLYAFDGFEPAIRQSVDPKWPNVTPYVVLIDRAGVVQRVIGPPNATQLKAWLR